MGISDAFVTTGQLNLLGLFYLIFHLCVRVYEREETQFLDNLFSSPEVWEPERPRGGGLDVMRKSGVGV